MGRELGDKCWVCSNLVPRTKSSPQPVFIWPVNSEQLLSIKREVFKTHTHTHTEHTAETVWGSQGLKYRRGLLVLLPFLWLSMSTFEEIKLLAEKKPLILICPHWLTDSKL